MPKTILAVDDSSSLRQMVAFSLKAAGYLVVEAVDGQDGLEKAKLQTVDLVLTDQNMPRMDGLELIKLLREMPGYQKVPILMLTTESSDDEIEGPCRRRQWLAAQTVRSPAPDRGCQEGNLLRRTGSTMMLGEIDGVSA